MTEPYRVAPPLASGPLAEGQASAGTSTSGEPRPRAVFVAHGMGQQVPFETLDQVARGLCEEIEDAGAEVVERAARTVRVGCETLQRLELDVRSKEGEKLRPIHLYEGYWAPLTEGVAGLRHVVRFLLSGAFNGLRSNARLHRFMFGKPRQFHISRWGLALLGAVVITLIAVLIIGGTISVAGIIRLLFPGHRLVNDPLLRELTALFELLLGVLAGASAVAVVIVAISRSLKRWPKAACIVSALTAVPVTVVVAALWISAYLAIPVIIAFNETPLFFSAPCGWCPGFAAAGAGWLGRIIETVGKSVYMRVHQPLRCGLPEKSVWFFLAGAGVVMLAYAVKALFWPDGDEPRRKEGGRHTAVVLALLALAGILALCGQTEALGLITWLLLFGAVLFVRSFLIQYIGDVAVYVSPHVVDRFFDLRSRIRSVVWRSARAVYAHEDDDGEFLYDGVVVAGHSLGSVVVYDVLNRLLNEDILSAGKPPTTCADGPLENLKINIRTRLLLTFGSPLDKTAFVFANHNLQAGSERDALAASVQPLIAEERRFAWTNLYSGFDILGGRLDYYDTPEGDPEPNKTRVRNLTDPDAITPFLAHTEFWKNKLLYKAMYEALR
jgi:hypothetical protein